jgi:hypothetical protein
MTVTSPRGSASKAVLFCRECGHENPVDGDWATRERTASGDRQRVYECPVCRATVETRPLFELAAARP